MAAQYHIVSVQAQGPIGTDFTAAAAQLTELVNKALREGFEPVGGVAIAEPIGGGQPTLMQALVRRAV